MIATEEILQQLSEIRGIECTKEDLKHLINVVDSWQREVPVKGSDATDALRRMENTRRLRGGYNE